MLDSVISTTCAFSDPFFSAVCPFSNFVSLLLLVQKNAVTTWSILPVLPAQEPPGLFRQ